MTKLISILFLVLYLSPLKQDEPISRIANFNLPNNVEEISTTQLSTYIKQNYKYLIHFGDIGKIFKIEDVILVIKDYDVKSVDFVDLQQKRQMSLGVYKELKMESSNVRADIIKIKKTSFLILGHFHEDEYAYSILSEAKGKTGLGIQMRFKKTDKDKAEKLLMEFLSGITFRPASIVNN